jgi:hypothetical protein
MTATYLINRMPSRVLGMKTRHEMIYGKNEFIVPPSLDVRALLKWSMEKRLDMKWSMEKLDPHVVKCIFIGHHLDKKATSVNES